MVTIQTNKIVMMESTFQTMTTTTTNLLFLFVVAATLTFSSLNVFGTTNQTVDDQFWNDTALLNQTIPDKGGSGWCLLSEPPICNGKIQRDDEWDPDGEYAPNNDDDDD